MGSMERFDTTLSNRRTPLPGDAANLDRYMPLAIVVSAICAAFLIFFAR